MDNVFKSVVAMGGAAASFLWGGWSALLSILLAFVFFDYFSGVYAAWKEQTLSSRIGIEGIARKVFIFAMIAVAHLVDTALGDQHIFRDATIWFYLANELLSIIENAGRAGFPIPEPIQRAVGVLKGKGEAK